jgi:hypothetical protein
MLYFFFHENYYILSNMNVDEYEKLKKLMKNEKKQKEQQRK